MRTQSGAPAPLPSSKQLRAPCQSRNRTLRDGPETHGSQPQGYPFKMKTAACSSRVATGRRAPVLAGLALGADPPKGIRFVRSARKGCPASPPCAGGEVATGSRSHSRHRTPGVPNAERRRWMRHELISATDRGIAVEVGSSSASGLPAARAKISCAPGCAPADRDRTRSGSAA